jgi:hypothetical protein
MSPSLQPQAVTFRRMLADGRAEAITDDGVIVLIAPAAMAAFRHLRVGQRLLAVSGHAGLVTEVRLPA